MAIDQQPLELSADFREALDLMEKEKRNLFVTGKAGTGKSTLLNLFRSTTRRKVVVLAPTGIAALNVRGQTIHSFFGFPPRFLHRREIKKQRKNSLYKNMDVLIIDEISMVRCDLLDNIDYFLRINRENPMPFGGLQVIFFGDLFQLPPVVRHDAEKQIFEEVYASPYFFSAEVFQEFSVEMFELRKVYRQDNRHFLRLLEAIRLNRLDQDDLEELNERHLPAFEPEDFYITLTATNNRADQINQRALEQIAQPEQVYEAKIKGDFSPANFPTDPLLRLKVNAQVMFIRNDPERQFVNGTIGKIVKLEPETVTVMIENGAGAYRYVETGPLEWEVLRYIPGKDDPSKIEVEAIGSFSQIPLRLAWAVTIHKAQGKTFDKVIIDLGRGAFEHGQTYVALSRCRTLNGIVLRQALRYSDILTDSRIVDFYERFF